MSRRNLAGARGVSDGMRGLPEKDAVKRIRHLMHIA